MLDVVGVEQAWLVGSSAGGRVAVDAALAYPERVAGLVLLAPAVSGEPDVEFGPETERLDALMEAADAAGDLDEVNRLEAWLWLDGPAGPEGRVSGPVRELFLAMNAIALRAEAESPAGAGNSEIDAWSRLAEITVPVTVAWGELDIEVLNDRCRSWSSGCPRRPAASCRTWPICPISRTRPWSPISSGPPSSLELEQPPGGPGQPAGLSAVRTGAGHPDLVGRRAGRLRRGGRARPDRLRRAQPTLASAA